MLSLIFNFVFPAGVYLVACRVSPLAHRDASRHTTLRMGIEAFAPSGGSSLKGVQGGLRTWAFTMKGAHPDLNLLLSETGISGSDLDQSSENPPDESSVTDPTDDSGNRTPRTPRSRDNRDDGSISPRTSVKGSSVKGGSVKGGSVRGGEKKAYMPWCIRPIDNEIEGGYPLMKFPVDLSLSIFVNENSNCNTGIQSLEDEQRRQKNLAEKRLSVWIDRFNDETGSMYHAAYFGATKPHRKALNSNESLRMFRLQRNYSINKIVSSYSSANDQRRHYTHMGVFNKLPFSGSDYSEHANSAPGGDGPKIKNWLFSSSSSSGKSENNSAPSRTSRKYTTKSVGKPDFSSSEFLPYVTMATSPVGFNEPFNKGQCRHRRPWKHMSVKSISNKDICGYVVKDPVHVEIVQDDKFLPVEENTDDQQKILNTSLHPTSSSKIFKIDTNQTTMQSSSVGSFDLPAAYLPVIKTKPSIDIPRLPELSGIKTLECEMVQQESKLESSPSRKKTSEMTAKEPVIISPLNEANLKKLDELNEEIDRARASQVAKAEKKHFKSKAADLPIRSYKRKQTDKQTNVAAHGHSDYSQQFHIERLSNKKSKSKRCVRDAVEKNRASFDDEGHGFSSRSHLPLQRMRTIYKDSEVSEPRTPTGPEAHRNFTGRAGRKTTFSALKKSTTSLPLGEEKILDANSNFGRSPSRRMEIAVSSQIFAADPQVDEIPPLITSPLNPPRHERRKRTIQYESRFGDESIKSEAYLSDKDRLQSFYNEPPERQETRKATIVAQAEANMRAEQLRKEMEEEDAKTEKKGVNFDLFQHVQSGFSRQRSRKKTTDYGGFGGEVLRLQTLQPNFEYSPPIKKSQPSRVSLRKMTLGADSGDELSGMSKDMSNESAGTPSPRDSKERTPGKFKEDVATPPLGLRGRKRLDTIKRENPVFIDKL
eukprot:GHVP01056977.1.p1 GENE.GHVP01056977.1~~GHVP01056977.1.p1  ORF type:complete len:932 (+),score=172.93 GHVP01056977.1:6182-8977(+)